MGTRVQSTCYLSIRRQADDHCQVISEYLLSLLPTETAPLTLDTEPLRQTVSALINIYSLVASVDGVRKSVKGINWRKEGGRELKRRGEIISLRP